MEIHGARLQAVRPKGGGEGQIVVEVFGDEDAWVKLAETVGKDVGIELHPDTPNSVAHAFLPNYSSGDPSLCGFCSEREDHTVHDAWREGLRTKSLEDIEPHNFRPSTGDSDRCRDCGCSILTPKVHRPLFSKDRSKEAWEEPPVQEQPVAGGHQQTWDFGIPEQYTEVQDRAEALADWWMRLSVEEVQRTVPKSIEYGSADLKIMGEAMLQLVPQMRKSIEDNPGERVAAGQEMAIAFYVLGKVARLLGAYEQGRMPSEDTWFDLGIYPKMVRRIRETGTWG